MRRRLILSGLVLVAVLLTACSTGGGSSGGGLDRDSVYLFLNEFAQAFQKQDVDGLMGMFQLPYTITQKGADGQYHTTTTDNALVLRDALEYRTRVRVYGDDQSRSRTEFKDSIIHVTSISGSSTAATVRGVHEYTVYSIGEEKKDGVWTVVNVDPYIIIIDMEWTLNRTGARWKVQAERFINYAYEDVDLGDE